MHYAFNQKMQREQENNRNEFDTLVIINFPKLNQQQKHAYETIMDKVQNNGRGMIFLDAPGGTEKIFLISLLLATIIS